MMSETCCTARNSNAELTYQEADPWTAATAEFAQSSRLSNWVTAVEYQLDTYIDTYIHTPQC